MKHIQPTIIQLPKICDPRGNLSFIQNGSQILFDIARCYWIYDVPGGKMREPHAFRSQEQLIVAMSGCFDVVITEQDGSTKRFRLDRSDYGLYIPPMTWRGIDNFSTNSVAMILSSTIYIPEDYIDDFETFKSLKK
ncbi:MAG: sugar 3,4-ketoisomerase [Muribaculaceae bacterium]